MLICIDTYVESIEKKLRKSFYKIRRKISQDTNLISPLVCPQDCIWYSLFINRIFYSESDNPNR